MVEEYFHFSDMAYLVLGAPSLVQHSYQLNVVATCRPGTYHRTVVQVQDDTQQISILCFCLVHAPQNRCTAVAELLMRVNASLDPCQAHVDFNNGEICTRSTLQVRDTLSWSKDPKTKVVLLLYLQQLDSLMQTTTKAMNDLVPYLIPILFGGADSSMDDGGGSFLRETVVTLRQMAKRFQEGLPPDQDLGTTTTTTTTTNPIPCEIQMPRNQKVEEYDIEV